MRVGPHTPCPHVHVPYLPPAPTPFATGVKGVDDEDIAVTGEQRTAAGEPCATVRQQAPYVPRYGFKLEGRLALQRVTRESSVYEMQKFMSRLVTAGRVIVLVGERLPGRAERAVAVAAELEGQWAEALADARCVVRGEAFAPERDTRVTPVREPEPGESTQYGTRSAGPASAPTIVPRALRARALLSLYALRTFTGATSATYGHSDTFGEKVTDGIENKMTIVLDESGAWEQGPVLHELPTVGLLPPGALGYARTKAATICRAGRDFEFHQLARAVHLAADRACWLRGYADVQPPPASLMRGVWDAHGRLHVHGVALCDWWYEKTRAEQRAWLRDRGRAVEWRAVSVLSGCAVIVSSQAARSE